MSIQASEECALERHMRMHRDVSRTVEFLKQFGGHDLRFNQFADTVNYLSGVEKGMRLADNAHESAAYQKERFKEPKAP